MTIIPNYDHMKRIPCVYRPYAKSQFNLQALKISALQAAYRKREASTPRDEAPSAGQIRSLGLLEGSDAEKNMKHGSLLPTMSTNSPN